jgi:predicted transcriptional regulator YheO
MRRKGSLQAEKDEILGNREFSITDKLILHLFEPLVDGIGKIFGDNCEVILYSLENTDSAAIKVANGHVTGRALNSPLTILEINILRKSKTSKKDVIDVYFAEKEDGKLIKSTKCIIRNFENEPIGMLCINMNLSAPFIDVISEFIPTEAGINPIKPARYPASPQDLIKQSLEIVLAQVRNTKKISQVERNKLVVFEMYDIGLFDIKGAVDLVATEMGVSRYTIYNYIREAKIKAGEADAFSNRHV